MNVGTLKKYLDKYDDNMEVRLHDFDGLPVLFTCALKGVDAVYLQTEADVDMADEIQSRLDSIVTEGNDETMVYLQMLEQGITVDTVRKYLGDNAADRMKYVLGEE